MQISLPQGWNVDALLPSFRAFRCPDEAEETEKLLTCTVYAAAETERPSGVLPGTLLESTVNDMGYVSLYKYDKEAEGYCVTLPRNKKEDCMSCRPTFSFLLSRYICMKTKGWQGMHCLPYFGLPIRRRCFTVGEFPSMLRRSFAETGLSFSWAEAGPAKAHMRHCG